MNLPEELRYTAEHLWVRAEGDLFYAGITDFAQQQLSDIVYVEVETEGEHPWQRPSIWHYRSRKDTLRPLHASLRRDYRLQQRACT